MKFWIEVEAPPSAVVKLARSSNLLIICTVTEFEVLSEWFDVPTNVAIKECTPKDWIIGLSVAIPFPSACAVPSDVVPSKNSTCGLSVGAGSTVAVKVNEVPYSTRGALETRDVVVGVLGLTPAIVIA
ncbi:unnamed protein product [marine sediment metagenome]|uniref:Uncharacterized protein n=1 Tax=marine sediment metagenome TaxID=412755 RepID=X1GNS6_9ZZZZ